MHANLFHLGHLHIPVFSAFAAVALILALLLSQRTAPFAGLKPDDLWDAGIFATITAFVISRILLVVTNLKTFRAEPLLILSLPSLTYTGLLLTAIALYLFLLRRHLPIARVLDAAAPCLALLWAILSLGQFATGSTGMPTTLPWGLDDSLLGPIHPIEVYTAAAALLLMVLLYRALSIAYTHNEKPGKTIATALFLAGPLVFLLDFLSQPSEVVIAFLDPIQWIALAMLLIGFFLLLPSLTNEPAPHQAAQQESHPHAI